MLSGPEKTALLLLLLEEPQAAGLLARLEPAEVEAIGRAMLGVAEASPATIDAVLDEVLAIARETVAVGEGPTAVRDLIGRALGEDRAASVIERLGPAAREPLFERLHWLEPGAISALIADEHPQVQALLLAQMPPPRAAAVLAGLPAPARPDLVRRVATLGPVGPAVLETLDGALTERVVAARPRPPVAGLGGLKLAADLVNLAGLDEAEALAALTATDPAQGQALAETLFTFDDLDRLSDRALQTLMRSLEAELLVPALRAAPVTLRERLLGAMPQRAAQALADEIENRGPVRFDEALAAQKAIAAEARRLAAAGEISLPGKGPAYV